MRSVDSLPNHSMDSKPQKTSWDSLSSGSNNWDTLKSIDNPDDSDSPNYSRPLDYPDSWKKLDLPHEIRELPTQDTNQQTISQAKESDLIDMPLDADLLEYVNSVGATSGNATPSHFHTLNNKTEVQKKREYSEHEWGDLLAILDQEILGLENLKTNSTLNKDEEQEDTEPEKTTVATEKTKDPDSDDGKHNKSETSSDFIDSINNCNSYQEMTNLIDERVKELSSQSKKVARMGAKQGVMGKSAFSGITHYDGFITPETIIDGSWDGGITYHIYDNDYLYRFASGIKRQSLPKNANLLQQIMPMLDSYFGFPKDSTDNREKVLDEWMIQNAESFYEKHPEKRQSEWFENGFDQMSISGDTPISAFEGKNVAQCIERAALAQNLLKICGYDSEIAFGYCASRDKTEAHAFNLVKIGDKDYLIDFSNTVHKYADGKFVGRQPYYVILDQNNKDAFLSGKKIVESIDYHYENGKRVNENRTRKYKIGDN